MAVLVIYETVVARRAAYRVRYNAATQPLECVEETSIYIL